MRKTIIPPSAKRLSSVVASASSSFPSRTSISNAWSGNARRLAPKPNWLVSIVAVSPPAHLQEPKFRRCRIESVVSPATTTRAASSPTRRTRQENRRDRDSRLRWRSQVLELRPPAWKQTRPRHSRGHDKRPLRCERVVRCAALPGRLLPGAVGLARVGASTRADRFLWCA